LLSLLFLTLIWKEALNMGARRIRREQRREDMAQSRHVNSIRKTKERERRDQRMTAILKKTKRPYAPAVMSWLSAKLNKPSRLISDAEIKKLVGARKV
jgi:hypothetical protein